MTHCVIGLYFFSLIRRQTCRDLHGLRLEVVDVRMTWLAYNMTRDSHDSHDSHDCVTLCITTVNYANEWNIFCRINLQAHVSRKAMIVIAFVVSPSSNEFTLFAIADGFVKTLSVRHVTLVMSVF